LLRWQSTEAPLELVPVGDVQEVVARIRDVHRQDAKIRRETALARRLGETRSDDEAMEPGVEPVRIAESRQITPGDHQRVLQGILGPIDVTKDPLSERVEAVATHTDQVGVCLPVTAPCRLDKIAIHGLRFLGGAQRGRCPAPMGAGREVAFNLRRLEQVGARVRG
jgi:hypothetical protein